MGNLIGTMKTSVPRKFWGLDSGQKGQFYLISELHSAEQVFEIKQHKAGERMVVCPGQGCEACARGDEPEKRYALTLYLPDTKKKMLAVLRYGKQGVLKKLIARWEFLKEQASAESGEEAQPAMKGDLFVAERASDGFSYDLQYVGSFPDKVKDITPFTHADVLAKMKAGDRN